MSDCKPKAAKRSTQAGLTLTELLVASAVALLLLFGVVSLYLANQSSFRHQEVTARLNENGRFALDLLAFDLRNAGYTGCGAAAVRSNIVTGFTTHWWLDSRSMLRGYDTATGYPADLVGAANDSDALVVMYRDNESELSIVSHDPVNARFTLGNNHVFGRGEILFATDCVRDTVFQMSGPDPNLGPTNQVEHRTGTVSPGNCQVEMGSSCGQAPATTYTYATGGFVSRLIARAFYVAPASVGQGNSLYVRSLAGGTQGAPITFEIVPNVQAMRIRYGLDLDCNGMSDRFASAAQVNTTPPCAAGVASPWEMVVSARIEILLLSEEINITADNQRFCMDYKGTGDPGVCSAANYNYVFVAPNRRAGRVFSTTVALRNRVM